jgi:hypothetical protein
LPTALDAAVAADQFKAIRIMLDWIPANLRRQEECECWADTCDRCNAPEAIISAMGAAIRLHKKDAGHIILTSLATNCTYVKAVFPHFATQLFSQCIRYGNVHLLYAACIFEQTGTFDAEHLRRPAEFKIDTHHGDYICSRGYPSALRALIKHGLLDQIIAMFALALSHHQYELARVLLAHGAHIDVLHEGKTALYHAAEKSHVLKVQFLFEHSTNPQFIRHIHEPIPPFLTFALDY